MKNITIVPFVKWVGGKRQLTNKIIANMPKDFNNYYEPFVGGGALLFRLLPETAFISDLNKELINTYQVIKSDHKKLREYLLLIEYGHSKEMYTKIREIDKNILDGPRKLNMNDSKVLRAARFIYLNKAGFNGLYRVNNKGYFNVPFGKKKRINTFDLDNLKNISNYLKNISIRNLSFEKAIKSSQENDFIYFDPPYDYENSKQGFDSYQKGGFGKKGQNKLAKICRELDIKGVKWMVSNHNTTLIRELYKDFNIKVIKAKRLVGGKGASRKDVEEVIITNYEVERE